MGETNSKPQPNHDFLRVFQREYKEIGEENDTRLGGVKVYQGPQGNLVAVKMSLAYQKEDVENFMDKNLPSLLNIQTRYLMKVLSYKTHAEDSMCGSVNGITTYHEYYQNTVQDELVRRKQVSLFYTEQELWAILYSIVSAAYYAEKYGLKPLSDIRPSTVYFTLKGEVKIMPFGIYPEDIGGYHKCFHQSEQTYLSPEQMDLMRERVTRSEVDQFKSDIYSIGVTLLSCATLQTAPTWYNYNDCVIDFNYINGLLQFAQNQNSDFFYKIIRIMLSEKVEDRPTATTIYRCLQPFEKEILALKPFNPDKEVIKKSIEQENKHSTELHTQGDKLFAEETPLPQGNQPGANSIIISVPFQGDDGKLYYQQTPQQQFEYLIQQSDGQPIPQLENQFFYHDQVQQVQYQQPQQQQPSAPVYVVNEPVNQSGVYVSYSQPGAQQVPQQVEYVYPNTAVSGVQYVQQTAQPQVILNGARQQYSQVLTQPPVQYQQVYQENNSAPLGAASQLILNPTPQPNVQYVQTTSSPYHPGQSQIIAQYSYNIEEKPFLSTQQPQGAYPATGAEITNSHVQINPMVYGNTLQPVAQQEEQVKKAMRQPQSDQQMVNQDIYSNQIYNNAPSYQVNYNATHEPESPIGMVSHNQQNADINSSAAFQLGGYRTDAVSNSNAGLNPNVNANNNYTVTNQYYTSNNNNNNNNSNDLMNDMNRRITEALQRTQTVLSNNNTTTNINHY